MSPLARCRAPIGPLSAPTPYSLASRPSDEWNDDDFDVLVDGVVVGRILKVHAAPVGQPWLWALAFGHKTARRRTATQRRARTR
jgi:hypothetical protein